LLLAGPEFTAIRTNGSRAETYYFRIPTVYVTRYACLCDLSGAAKLLRRTVPHPTQHGDHGDWLDGQYSGQLYFYLRQIWGARLWWSRLRYCHITGICRHDVSHMDLYLKGQITTTVPSLFTL